MLHADSTGFAPLDVAAATRMHRELGVALKFGLVDPDASSLEASYANVKLAIKIARSTTPWAPQDLQLHAGDPLPPIRVVQQSGNRIVVGYETLPAKPVCKRTIRLIIAATKGEDLWDLCQPSSYYPLLLVNECLPPQSAS